MMEYTVQEGFFPSANQSDSIAYRILTPKENPVGILLMLHGMGSHSGRYMGVGEFFTSHGYVVFAYDQAGHGKSVGDSGIFGSFAEKDGDAVLVKDMHTAVEMMRSRYRHLPFFVFGHSLGSFVARAYVVAHPDCLDGAIFSGTCERIELPSRHRRKLEKLAKKTGREYSPEVEELMIGDFAKAFPEKGGWITTNPAAFGPKGSDPYFGHPMCADAYCDMYRLMHYISGDEWVEGFPKSLPVLFLSGERDPLGGYGEGIQQLADTLAEGEVSSVAYRIYPGEKHETLGSLSDSLVRNDMLRWLKEKTEEKVALMQSDFFRGFSY